MSGLPNEIVDATYTAYLPKLDEDSKNWLFYKTRMESAFAARGLMWHVNGKARKPVPKYVINDKGHAVDAAGVAVSADVQDASDRAEDDYEQKEGKVIDQITRTLSSVIITRIKAKKPTTVAEWWKYVVGKSEGRSQLVVADLEHRLTSMKCQESDDV